MNESSHSRIVDQLFARIANIPVIDSHEHLVEEFPIEMDLGKYLGSLVPALLNTTNRDEIEHLVSLLSDMTVPIEKRFPKIESVLEKVFMTSQARIVMRSFRELFGIEEISDSNVVELSEKIKREFAEPGIFKRVLADSCNIETTVAQPTRAVENYYFDYDRPQFKTVYRPTDAAIFTTGGLFEENALKLGIELHTIDDVIQAMDTILYSNVEKGAVGFKICAAPWTPVSADELKSAFKSRDSLHEGMLPWNPFLPKQPSHPLYRLYVARMAEIAREKDLFISIHTGPPVPRFQDFREFQARHLIPLLLTYPDTKFEILHCGMPNLTETAMIIYDYPNTWANLTWVINKSTTFFSRTVNEYLDLLNTEKVIAFGGDSNNEDVLNVAGTLHSTKLALAQCFGARVEDGQLTIEQAEKTIRQWLYDNPKRLYKLRS